MNTAYLKIPCEMAQFALTETKYRPVASYLASHFIYSGKAPVGDKSAHRIASATGSSTPTVYRHFKWLLNRDWIGKDSENGWYFFRGLDFVRRLEGWQRSRAVVMLKKDLQQAKEFFTGAVIASIIKTGQGAETERISRRSEQFGFPVSLSLIQKVLGCSRKTAFTYRKDAQKAGYIKMIQNLQQVDVSPGDIRLLKQNELETVTVRLFGTRDETIDVKPDQLRTDKGYVYAQLANLIEAVVLLKKRNG